MSIQKQVCKNLFIMYIGINKKVQILSIIIDINYISHKETQKQKRYDNHILSLLLKFLCDVFFATICIMKFRKTKQNSEVFGQLIFLNCPRSKNVDSNTELIYKFMGSIILLQIIHDNFSKLEFNLNMFIMNTSFKVLFEYGLFQNIPQHGQMKHSKCNTHTHTVTPDT